MSLDRERARKLVGRTWQSGPRRPKCRGIDLAATHLESCLTSVHCLANAGCKCRDNRTFQVTYAFKDMIHGDGFLGQESDHTFGNERDQELGRYRCHRWAQGTTHSSQVACSTRTVLRLPESHNHGLIFELTS